MSAVRVNISLQLEEQESFPTKGNIIFEEYSARRMLVLWIERERVLFRVTELFIAICKIARKICIDEDTLLVY
uniref:Uncharacterized protein n=1 Tax=Romanomermis culicivorax TaxID=13658 RepID=A0A915LA71_ROMCU